MQSLRGSVVITGAAGTAGISIAQAFARHGCQKIFLADTTSDGLTSCREAIVNQYPSAEVNIHTFDRSSEKEVDQYFSKLTEINPRIDYAVNIISRAQDQQHLPTGLDIEEYDRSFSIYQKGAFLIQRALLRQMLKQDILEDSDSRGSIVNVVEYGPTPSLADYPIVAAVANAILGMSRTDAADYAQDNIRVNSVAAGEVLLTKEKPELPGGVPLPRKGKPDDVSNAVTWLSSPSSSWLTGLVVPIDGGRNLNHFW